MKPIAEKDQRYVFVRNGVTLFAAAASFHRALLGSGDTGALCAQYTQQKPILPPANTVPADNRERLRTAENITLDDQHPPRSRPGHQRIG